MIDGWDLGDVLLGKVNHTGNLNGGASYTGQLTAALPLLKDGNWRVIVRPANPLPQAQQLQLQQAIQNRTFIDPTSNQAWPSDNDQRAALMDFAAMYSLTQDAGGSWRNIQLQNTDNAQNDIRKGLFGGGNTATGLISKVWIGDAAYTDRNGVFHPLDKNPLTNIRNALARLGVNYDAANAHQNHFHIYFRPPAAVRIGGGTANLLANEANTIRTYPSDIPLATESIQDWLNDAAADGIELLEDFTMFTFDAPEAHIPPQTVLIAQASTPSAQKLPPGHFVNAAQSDAGAASIKPDMTLVSCQSPGYNTLSPEVAIEIYFDQKLNQQIDTDNAKVAIIEPTKKAALSYFRADDGRSRGWRYQGSTEVKEGVSTKPNGIDQATFLVTVKNLSTGKMMNIRLIDRIGLTGVRPPDADDNTTIDCGPIRRISATDSMHDLAAWGRSAGLSSLLASGDLMTYSGMPLSLPAKASNDLDQALEWMQREGRSMDQYINKKATPMEQALQAVRIQEYILLASRNSLRDGNLISSLNAFHPLKTFDELRGELGQKYAGVTLWEKIAEAAKRNTERVACFVAGTLVHTREGLRPIEQIKVGDFVLSKPESGSGETAYKRVIRTIESEAQEAEFVSWYDPALLKKLLDEGMSKEDYFAAYGNGFVVTTPNHPFWVVESDDEWLKYAESHVRLGPPYPKQQWVRADHLATGMKLLLA